MSKSKLFTPLRAGHYQLRNRIIMAPMTRARSDDNGVPGELVPKYYAQRASAGLIISEGIYPSPMGKGYVRTPGMHTEAQVAAWNKVTAAVHARDGRIFAQIMHVGRISHPSLLPGNATPVAPSAIQPNGSTYTDEGMKPHVRPRALETHEIKAIIRDFGQATQRALDAGFDGVELHAASGYLPMQFLSTGANQRSDEYGGSAQNRARFVVEALEEMVRVAGAERVGIKIAPEMAFNDISDADPRATYTTLVKAIAGKGLAYLHVTPYGKDIDYHALLRPLFEGAYFAGAALDQTQAEAMVDSGKVDAAVFGGLFLANPDLPRRFWERAPLNVAHQETFYAGGAKGYIDYPELEKVAA